MLKDITRRQFVATALSTAAISSLAGAKPALANSAAAKNGALDSEQQAAAQTAGDSFPSGAWQDQGILNLAKSPYAKLHNVPVRAVTIEDGFWAARREVNVTESIPTMHDLMESHGRMNNFRRLIGQSNAPQISRPFADTDVYKWTEAVAFTLQSGDRAELRKTSEEIIDLIVAVQKPNGYINTYFVDDRAALSMTPETQLMGHELYCLGHMLQGAIAYYRATGERKWLDAGIRMVDDFLLPTFGPAPKQPIISGHPEVEMALIELYRITGDRRQLDMAGYILGGDSRIPVLGQVSIYLFSGTPFTQRTQVEGHAVRAMYACCGATDYYMETGDATYWKTLNTLWDSMAGTKMYVTGGVGSRASGESFGDAYDLPNASAYAETCAAIGNMMWNWRMLAASGDAKFTDVLERALYNGVNSGMSLGGTLYCYRNPLALDPASTEVYAPKFATYSAVRNPWYETICCPPNFERTIASLPGYFYSTASDGLYLHLYDNSTLDWHLEDGTGLRVTQKNEHALGWRRGNYRGSGAADRIYFLSAHSGLGGGRRNARGRERRGGFRRNARRLSRDPPPLGVRRRDSIALADDAAAAFGKSASRVRCRPRGHPARTARLLPRATRSAGGRRSLERVACDRRAARRRIHERNERRFAGRNRGAASRRRGRGSGVAGGLAGFQSWRRRALRAVQNQRAQHAQRAAHLHSILRVGQSRSQRDGSVDANCKGVRQA
jgi:DUF1680 family protein